MNGWPERRVAVLIGIASAHLLTAVGMAWLADHRRDATLLAGLLLGLMFGQVSLLAIWVVLGPLPAVIRWPGAVCGCLISAFMGIVFFGSDSGPDLMEVVLVLMATATALFVCVQVPLWWLRLRHGYHLQLPGEQMVRSGMGETQFSLRHLLIATTVVALILGVGRFMAANIPWSNPGSGLHLQPFLIFGNLIAFASGLTWLTLAGSFSRVRSAIVAPLMLLIIAPLSWLDATASELLMGRNSNAQDFIVIFLLNYIQFVWLFVALLGLRWARYQLVARPREEIDSQPVR